MSQPVIGFHDATKIYGGPGARRIAIESLSLTISEGETFGFIGPNGAGKSTAIKILLNLIFVTSGSAQLFGLSVTDPFVRRRVGYLPENPTFYDYLTPEELLWFGGVTAGVNRGLIKERTSELLKLVDLSHVRRNRLRTFSKGMVQRAGVALALINDPDVVILDEPMSGLDPLGRRLMADIIRRLHADGKTVFFSSHIMRDVEDLCDRVGIIVRGRMRRVATLADLASSESQGWRVVLRGAEEPIQNRLAGLLFTCESRGGLIEVKTPERDLTRLLERLGSFQDGIVTAVPQRASLEEIVLAEVERVGGNAQ